MILNHRYNGLYRDRSDADGEYGNNSKKTIENDIYELFEQELGLKTMMMGFGLDSDAIHSPNEHFGLFNYYRGIETIPYFFSNYTKLMLNEND